MKKHVFTVSDFREAWNEVIKSHHTKLLDKDAITLLKKTSDEKLGNSTLFSELGLDFISTMEIVNAMENLHGVGINGIEAAIGSDENLTVKEFLELLTENQEEL